MHRNPTVPRTQHSQNSLGEGAAHNSPRDSPIREPGTQDREVPTPNAAVLISRLLQWGWSPTQSQGHNPHSEAHSTVDRTALVANRTGHNAAVAHGTALYPPVLSEVPE